MSKTIDIIRRLRALPLTQAEISRRTGIPQPRICRWEAGNIPVGADDALRLADLLVQSESNLPVGLATQALPAAETVAQGVA